MISISGVLGWLMFCDKAGANGERPRITLAATTTLTTSKTPLRHLRRPLLFCMKNPFGHFERFAGCIEAVASSFFSLEGRKNTDRVVLMSTSVPTQRSRDFQQFFDCFCSAELLEGLKQKRLGLAPSNASIRDGDAVFQARTIC